MLNRWKNKSDKSVRWEELPNLHSDLQDLDLIIRSLISEKLSFGIREIIFCLSAEQALSLKKSGDFLKLIKDFKRAGFTISSADKDKILSTNVESSSKFFRYLESRSRNANCLVWTEGPELSQIESKYYDFLNHFRQIHGNEFEPFRPSRFTIRVKLLSIVSAIITLSMSLMITMATYFF